MPQAIHALDTSALLAHVYQEPGWQRVQELLHDDDDVVLGLASPVLFELQVRLYEKGVLNQHPEAIADYVGLFDLGISVDHAVAKAAFQLKRDTPQRLPAVDALIAACAKIHDATLVHRDPHISSIPGRLLKQEELHPKT